MERDEDGGLIGFVVNVISLVLVRLEDDEC